MYFRKTYRCEIARRELQLRENIMATRTRDCKTFHFLMLKKPRRGSLKGYIQDLNVNGEMHTGDQNIMEGFITHFQNLATQQKDPEFDYDYMVDYEIDIICELVSKNQIKDTTLKEVETAINGIKKGKAADIFWRIVENFIYGGNELISFIHSIICAIFKTGKVPDSVRTGMLSPVFKNEGGNINVKNYRGIKVLPVVCKIIWFFFLKKKILIPNVAEKIF